MVVESWARNWWYLSYSVQRESTESGGICRVNSRASSGHGSKIYQRGARREDVYQPSRNSSCPLEKRESERERGKTYFQ